MSALVEQIQKAYERDQQEQPIARTADELPVSFESITNEWLTAVLCKEVAGAEVTDFELGPVDTGSSNRRKITVNYNNVGQAAKLPTKIFCKASHDLVNRMTLAISGALNSEITFYNKVRDKLDIEAPHCYFAEYDKHSFNSMVILRDISDDVESFCDHHTPMNRARTESQMKLLAKFHARFYQSDELNTTLADLTTWPGYFTNTLQFGMKDGSNKGFLAAKEVIPPRLYERYEEIWPATEKSVAHHDSLPNTLAHNDVHLKNWYVLPNDQMGLSDWQCCSRGHWSRDLAYTISTALPTENRRHWEKDLIQLYLDEMAKNGVSDTSFEAAWDLYREQLLSALTWWTITLTPAEGMPDMQPRDITLEFIGRITRAIDDLDALSLF